MKLRQAFASFCLLAVFPINAFAASCDDYPEFEGVRTEIVDEQGNLKILSTESVAVAIDNRTVLNNARKRATMKAKGAIVKYLSDDVADACRDDDLTEQNINITQSGDVETKNVDFSQSTKTLCTITDQGRKLLRGAVQVGYCYSKGDVVMVTVGIKPETIRGAANLEKNMSNTSSGGSSSSSGSSGGSKVGGFSRFDSNF